MNEVPVFKLPLITCDESTLADVIKAILHTIVFHRALGQIEIISERCLKLGRISFMKSGDPVAENDINAYVKYVLANKNDYFYTTIGFSEEENTKYLGFFKQKRQRLFEKWLVPIKLTSSSVTQQDSISKVEDKLTEAILKVAEYANNNLDHFDETFDQHNQLKPLKYQLEITYHKGKIQE